MPWYVARTKAAQENKAAATLERRGIEVYLPTLAKRKPRAGERKFEPLFANYLFAKLELTSNEWLHARSAPFIQYFLGDGDEPVPLPDGFVYSGPQKLDRVIS